MQSLVLCPRRAARVICGGSKEAWETQQVVNPFGSPEPLTTPVM